MALLAAAAPASAQGLSLPSGEEVQPYDLLGDPDADGPAFWARYVAPWIAARDDVVLTEADMAHLCASDAVARIGAAAEGATVVIALMQRPVPFGEAAPDAAQAFEMYRITDGRCIWQGL